MGLVCKIVISCSRTLWQTADLGLIDTVLSAEPLQEQPSGYTVGEAADISQRLYVDKAKKNNVKSKQTFRPI